MKLTVFDLVTHLGGAQRSTAEFLGRVRNALDITFVDAYGIVTRHVEWIKDLGIPHVTLLPDARIPTIGHRNHPLRRTLRALRALPELITLRGRLRRHLIAHRPDLLMVISPKALRIALSASRGLPVKIIYWCRGSVVPANIVARGWHRRVAAFICLSDTIKRASVKAGVPEAKLRVVPNAIDVEELQKRAEAPLAGSLPDVDEPIRILVAATLLPGKGQACAIRALRRLRQEGRHAVLYLAGDTGSAGHKYEFELRRLAENLGVADSVHLLGWRDDLPQLMMKSTVFALPSHSEGMPRSVMEAMALRIPVVATPVGSVPEILDNGRAGYIVGIDDDAALAASIAAASQSAQVLTAKVQAAHEIISQRYVPPVQVRCFLDMIDSLCTSVVAQ